ncbi:hypothetical protein LP419_27815 [Massilia sp. H-1]|nr:hypothetical protein LP419_27815 [Massilia sp. H-1]
MPATEAQWIAAASAAVAFGQARGMPIALEVQGGDGLSGHTPVGIWSENGRCTLVVSARDNPTADRVSAMVDPAVLALFLAGAAMHEVGHCHRRLQGYPHNEKLLPVVAWMAPVRRWFTRRILTEEAYADMTEVAWLARYHPAQYGAVMREIVKVRTHFREPKHDTLPWLDRALAAGPQDDGRDLFLLADMHLARVR